MKIYSGILLLLIFLFCGCACFQNRKDVGIAQNNYLENNFKDGKYSSTVYFNTYSYDLGIEAEDSLMKVARLQAISNTHVYLSGHTDKMGTHNINSELSKNRSSAVEAYLVGLGVRAENINSVYFAEEYPVDSGDNPEAYAKNRRVEIMLEKKTPETNTSNFTEIQ